MYYLKVWDAELQSILKGFNIITNYKKELEVMCNLSPLLCVCVQLFCSPYNPLTPRHGSLLPLIYPFYMGQGY